MGQVDISIADQVLRYISDDHNLSFSVSTALNGAGEQENSGCTPRGQHRIRAIIGEGLPANTVFIGRRPTGEIYDQALANAFPNRDWVLTRILWLQGMELGKNRLGKVDSMRRYIYIHGTPDTEPMGIPKSHGCIRMRNSDLITLTSLVEPNTPVWIQEASFQGEAGGSKESDF